MNFVDHFILEENLGDHVLDEVNYSDIGLGILLGNLEKVKKISPNFCGNLQKNSKLDNFTKVVLLGRAFQIVSENSIELPQKNSQMGTELIGIFVEATQALSLLTGSLIYLKDYIHIIYSQAFYIVLDKLALNDNIRRIPLATYYIKEEFGLKCSLYNFEYDELEYLEKFTVIVTDTSLNLVKKGLEMIKSLNIPRNDVMAIVIYCEFQKLLEHLERIREFSYTELARGLIFTYKEQFSEKQLNRLHERLNKLGCRIEPEEYNQSHYKSIERREMGRKQPPQSIMKAPKYNNKVFKNNSESIINKNLRQQIKTAILAILEDLRNNYKVQIDNNELREQFIPIIQMNEVIVYEILEQYSYHEQFYSTRSIVVWNHICDALEDVKSFSREYYRKIVSNVQYIIENQSIHD